MTDPHVDAIIASTGLSRAGLDSTVAEWQDKSFHMETVLADHFNVEELASAVEQLAARLARIQDIAGGYTQADDHAGKLGRRIFALASPAHLDATGMVTTEMPGSQKVPYGHPDLVLVSEPVVDFEARRLNIRTHIVHPGKNRHTTVGAGENLRDACTRFEDELA